MIVDDSLFMRRMLRQICENFNRNIVIEEASTGLEAVKKCDTFLPDIIFMDITMPQMDGIEATGRIKKKMPAVKLIICSAIAKTSQAKEAIANGADELIAKPFKPDKIVQILEQLTQV